MTVQAVPASLKGHFLAAFQRRLRKKCKNLTVHIFLVLTETVVDFYIFWQIPSFTIACIIILFSWDWWSTTDCKGTETLPTTWDLMFFLFTFLLDFDDFIEWKNYIGQNKSEFSLIFEVNYALPFRGFIWQFMESTILVRSCKIVTFTSITIFKFLFKHSRSLNS